MQTTLEAVLQDLRYGVRILRRNPGFTFFAVLTIALGLGANAAIFSLVDGVLLKSLGYPEPERIVQLWEKPPRGLRNGIAAANYIDWVEQSRSFEAMAAQTGGTMSYSPASGGASGTSLDRCAWRTCPRRISTCSERKPRSAGHSRGTRTSVARKRSPSSAIDSG